MSLLGGPGGPIAIGGVGGSGTRLVAELLERAGVHLGSDLNAARDNLWFTLLFKHLGVLDWDDARFGLAATAFAERMHTGRVGHSTALVELLDECSADGRDQHDAAWLAQRRASFEHEGEGAGARRWGWKEPNTHVVLDRLDGALEDLRYVHVARSGLDMALSPNQNQLRLWGPSFGVADGSGPADSLRFWCAAHRRVLDIGANMPGRFLLLRFEDLCADPVQHITRLLGFVGHDDPPSIAAGLAAVVSPPTSIGRAEDLSMFDAADVDYVASLGFELPSAGRVLRRPA